MAQLTDPHKKDSLYASLKLTSGAIAFLTALTLIFSSLLPLPAWADYGDKLPLPNHLFKAKLALLTVESMPGIIRGTFVLNLGVRLN